MKKLQQLREFLINSIYELKNDPDRLIIRADSGIPVCHMGNNISIEYRYDAQFMILDYAGDIDTLMVPLLIWLSEHQNELLVNPEKARTSIQFTIDVLDNSKVDIKVSFPLTERHIASTNEHGHITMSIPPEPQYEKNWNVQEYEIQDTQGSTLAKWQSANKDGSSLTMPYPTKS